MKLRYSFEMVDMGNEIIAVPVGRDANKLRGIIKTNREGKRLMEMMSTHRTTSEMVDELSHEVELRPDILQGYIESFINKLDTIGLLEY